MKTERGAQEEGSRAPAKEKGREKAQFYSQDSSRRPRGEAASPER